MEWLFFLFLPTLCSQICLSSVSPQCLTSPSLSTSHRFDLNDSFGIFQSSLEFGQWPLESSFRCNSVGISLEISPPSFAPSSSPSLQLYSHVPLPAPLVSSWKLISEEFQSPACQYLFDDILFLPIPYDPSEYQSDGSNYYVVHVDILLPLWNFLRSKPKASSPFIILFPFNSKTQRDESSFRDRNSDSAFHNIKKYWIHSLQLLSDHQALIPGDLIGLSTLLLQSRPHLNFKLSWSPFNSGRVCFQNIQLGLPRYDRPSPISVRTFSQRYREAALLPSPLFPHLTPQTISAFDQEISRQICNVTNISIGLVIREGRRKIQNEKEFILMIQRIALSWCYTHRSPAAECQIHIPKIFFGRHSSLHATTTARGTDSSGPRESTIEADLTQIQLLSALIGLQGSGLINGLYLSRFTSVVVYYLNDGWPISSGDPLELLSARGPYLTHINTDPSKVSCNLSDDQYCDSGDLRIDEETYARTITEALDRHQASCLKEPTPPRTNS